MRPAVASKIYVGDVRADAVLAQLHAAAAQDRWRFLRRLPEVAVSYAKTRSFAAALHATVLRDLYIPVSPEQGQLLYLLARATGARQIVEFGTSFGVSTIYLAAAVRDNLLAFGGGAGKVIGSEFEPTKQLVATRNLAAAGLAAIVDIKLGDAMQTLPEIDVPIDLLLLDGRKELYLPLLQLLTPKLRRGALVFADNIFTFKKDLAPYVRYVQSGVNGFRSGTMPLADGFEVSVYTGT